MERGGAAASGRMRRAAKRRPEAVPGRLRGESSCVKSPLPLREGTHTARRPLRARIVDRLFWGSEVLAAIKGTASGLAKRYATALFELARESEALDRVAEDLATVREALVSSPELQRLIRSPVVPRQELEGALLALAERLGVHHLVRNLLGLLAQRRRLFALPHIITAYGEMLAAHRGEVTAEVTAAMPLDDKQLARLRKALEKQAGRTVKLVAKVDPDLIGGLVVRIGSRMIDASLKTKLQHLELSMKGVR